MRFNWQSPTMYKWAGLYLTIFDKRYVVWKVGKHWNSL